MKLVTIIGILAAFLTTTSFIPQMIKVVKSKSTGDLSMIMVILLTLGIFMWLIYGILITSYPVIIANALSLFFNSVILFYKFKYR